MHAFCHLQAFETKGKEKWISDLVPLDRAKFRGFRKSSKFRNSRHNGLGSGCHAVSLLGKVLLLQGVWQLFLS